MSRRVRAVGDLLSSQQVGRVVIVGVRTPGEEHVGALVVRVVHLDSPPSTVTSTLKRESGVGY